MKTISLSFAFAFVLASFAFADKGKNRSLDYMNSSDGKKAIKEINEKENNMTKEEMEKRNNEALVYSRGCYIVCNGSIPEIYYKGKKVDGIGNCMASEESRNKLKKQSEICGK